MRRSAVALVWLCVALVRAAGCGSDTEATSSTSDPATVTSAHADPRLPYRWRLPMSACALEPGTSNDLRTGSSASSGTPPTSGSRRLAGPAVGAMVGEWVYTSRPVRPLRTALVGPAFAHLQGKELTEVWLGGDGCKASGGWSPTGMRLWVGMCPDGYDGATTTDLYAVEGSEIVDHLVVPSYNCLGAGGREW